MYKTHVVLLAAAALVAVGAGLGGRAPAARVLELKGKASIVEGIAFERPAALYGTIYANERLTVDADSQVTLVFRGDGHIERVFKPGTYQVSPKGCTPTSGIEQVEMPEPKREVISKLSKGSRGIVQGGVVLVRAPAPPSTEDEGVREEDVFVTDWSKVLPRSDSIVMADRPKFTWPAVPDAKKYSLKLFHLSNQAWSIETDATEATYSGEAALVAGGTYWWEVTATVDGKSVSVCESSFHTANDSQREEAAAVEKMLEKPDPISLAVAAMWYRQNDMEDEAIEVNERLAKLSPSVEVYRELAELYYQTGRDEEGDAAAMKAEELERGE